ncbi:MAG: SGNH/GDSL hydrolase family protein [Roseburia sp.]|nr:SGNH/GDSL hydrolase family protein [Roseburia sp.]MCM1097073.1 SGNH/GDSL hydrolase family protein [Ruminococcus flavefaciens]
MVKTDKKKGKGKKVAITIIIILVILTPVQLIIMGWYGGIGPMGDLRDVRMGRLAGNQSEYDFSKIVPLKDSPLDGRNICVLGSSVVYGTASRQNSVGEYLAARFHCNLTKEAVSGTTLSDNGSNSYVQRMLNNIPADADFGLFICQLSTNDASKKVDLGNISGGRNLEDFDTATVTGAIEYIICYARETWGCPVVFFTGSRYDSAEYDAMVGRLLELQEKWNIGVIDLWSSDEFNNISDTDRKIYMSDGIHPTMAGYRDWWGPEMEKQLGVFLEQ